MKSVPTLLLRQSLLQALTVWLRRVAVSDILHKALRPDVQSSVFALTAWVAVNHSEILDYQAVSAGTSCSLCPP